MRRWLREPRVRRRVALATLALVVLAFAAPFVVGTDSRHLSAYRDGREDVSLVRDRLVPDAGELHAIVSTPDLLRDVTAPERTLYVAIGPERAYDDSEIVTILSFLRRGGRVLLADETGYGTPLAREAGFAFDSHRVLDANGYRNDPLLPVAQARLGTTPYTLLLNAPTVLKPLSSADPLLHEVVSKSSQAIWPNGSYLDVNENGEIDRADLPGPHPLVVRATVGAGTLVLVSDTGLFMNAQVNVIQYDNAAFVRDLVRSLVPADGTVLLDESRHAPPPALAVFDEAARTVGRLTAGPVATLVLLLILAAATALAWRVTRETEDWSHHAFDLDQEIPSPADVRPDLPRLQRLARRRISERYNIPLEQVAAMTSEQLLALTGDRTLAEAAAGALRTDPSPHFRDVRPEVKP